MEPYRTVKLPHLRHTVKFIDLSYLQGVEIKGSGYTAIEDENTTLVFIKDIENTVKDYTLAPWIAHELIHVLQILCDKINANFVNEQEHMAYIMHYLFCELQDNK